MDSSNINELTIAAVSCEMVDLPAGLEKKLS